MVKLQSVKIFNELGKETTFPIRKEQRYGVAQGSIFGEVDCFVFLVIYFMYYLLLLYFTWRRKRLPHYWIFQPVSYTTDLVIYVSHACSLNIYTNCYELLGVFFVCGGSDVYCQVEMRSIFNDLKRMERTWKQIKIWRSSRFLFGVNCVVSLLQISCTKKKKKNWN